LPRQSLVLTKSSSLFGNHIVCRAPSLPSPDLLETGDPSFHLRRRSRRLIRAPQHSDYRTPASDEEREMDHYSEGSWSMIPPIATHSNTSTPSNQDHLHLTTSLTNNNNFNFNNVCFNNNSSSKTGVGVSIFANKFPGVFAATCLTPEEAINARSINNSNVLAVEILNILLCSFGMHLTSCGC
jgi:hypothetical protein